MKHIRLLAFLLLFLNLGCVRGLFKDGPSASEAGEGIGLKVPVLGFGREETYDAENLSPTNIREEALNPFSSDPVAGSPAPQTR